ncbi:Type I restriction-modification system, specificity subunit S [Moritella sp. JT01]|uniref:restriction endonuclease subunit S n=1 Tax=Moritella sp. JT01 TaxID=756698 RepID=UPI00079A0F65|nr:restriction endonuclease subunit S [Moritella sp. JT01]KXO13110.1 Type I restriction-modification system, specificity subunit S [Moritella sp. JT01]
MINFEKSLWNKVKLGDVVTKKEENDKQNARNRFDRFLKVEHLDAESLHIKRWASQEEGDEVPPTFYKIFRKGQILFPTRNPHLRRSALASFDGICGEKTLTLEPNIELVVPDFLPFLFHSDSFYAHTISSIVGSTNPHVRWRDVAGFEFLLPPKKEQERILELFWSSDKEVQNKKVTKKELNKLLVSLIEKKIHGVKLGGKTINQVINELGSSVQMKTLGELGTIFKGKGIQKSEVNHEGLPCIRYGELYTKHHRVIREFHSFISEDSARKSMKIEHGDVLFASSGETISEIGKSAVFISDVEAYAGSDIIIFRPDSMDPAFSGYLMNSQLVRRQLNKFGTGATVMHVYGSDIKKIKVPVLSRNKQTSVGKELESVFKNISLTDNQIKTSQALHSKIINKVF